MGDRRIRLAPGDGHVGGSRPRPNQRLEDLRQLNATLEQRVEQRTKELAEAHRLAVLGKLIATVSHELRNPLAVIRNTTFALAEATKKSGLDVATLKEPA